MSKMEGNRYCGLVWVISAVIFSEHLHGVFGTLPLRSRSFQGKLHPQLTVTDDAGPSIQVVNNIANMADDLPPKRRMKTKKLFKRLGQAYDPEWMSVDKPESAVHQIIDTSNSTNKNLEQELTKVNFTMVHANGSVVSLEQSVLQAVQSWLVNRASCPIHYVWVDQGELWWPRWLKTGVCVDDTPCSWPPGMHCVPAENKVIQLLRWHCRSKIYPKRGWKKRFRLHSSDQSLSNSKYSQLKRQKTKRESGESGSSQSDDLVRLLQTRSHFKFRKSKKKCKWLRVPYPVTSECFCTC